MPITIRRAPVASPPPMKPAAVPPPPAARTPAPAPAVQPVSPPQPATAGPLDTRVPNDVMAKWARIPAVGAKPKLCAFCGQHYLVPCNEREKSGCANYAYVKQHGVAKRND